MCIRLSVGDYVKLAIALYQLIKEVRKDVKGWKRRSNDNEGNGNSNGRSRRSKRMRRKSAK